VTHTLLVVDDEPEFLRTLATNLRGAGYAVETATTVETALSAANESQFDGVVLDLVLPDGSGRDVCTSLRAWSDVPIVVVSAVGEEREKVEALDAGADDYVVKPFALASCSRACARCFGVLAPSSEPILRIGPLEIDREGRSVRARRELVHLTPHEFDLLRVLVRTKGS
jgi:two-component system KDP operon response regulator KdpE